MTEFFGWHARQALDRYKVNCISVMAWCCGNIKRRTDLSPWGGHRARHDLSINKSCSGSSWHTTLGPGMDWPCSRARLAGLRVA